MDINVNNKDTKVTITFTPAEYILVKESKECSNCGGTGMTKGADENGLTMDECYLCDGTGKDDDEWTLNHWIDMSYAGKCNQVGLPVLHLNDDQIDIFRRAGFLEGEY